MSQFSQAWKLHNLDFHLVIDDIFNVPVQAIVNSEQTDFILSWNPYTISGGINERYGTQVQEELNHLKRGRIRSEGTIIKTGPVGDYQAIYHAGFHHPWKFPDFKIDDPDQVEYLHIIRSCVRQILDDFARSEMHSVAFPLIGTGVFELDPALLAYEFMLELFGFAESTHLSAQKQVWLVIYSGDEDKLLSPVLNAIVQALIDRSSVTTVGFDPFQLGVSYIDEFELQFMHSYHPQWLAWLFARFAELITCFMYYHLALANQPPIYPPQVMNEDAPASFGTMRASAIDIVKSHPISDAMDSWTRFFASLIETDLYGDNCLQRLNTDRNNIAHGREFRSASLIRQDLLDFLHLDEWYKLFTLHGSPDLKHLTPWLAKAPSSEKETSKIGILDRWDHKKWTYLVPATGQSFKIPHQ
jgi:O-acetyl-ADP-ribose deacetylase (regulator of RNase III)